ncbi:MAG: hypothetical protein ACRCTG_14580 [Aestuariivirga sp.]
MTRATLVYSIHKTRERAEIALENGMADGDIMPCEFARIEKRGSVYCLVLWAD